MAKKKQKINVDKFVGDPKALTYVGRTDRIEVVREEDKKKTKGS